jgi:hypothetical protein
MSIAVGGRMFPAFRDPNDLLEVLSLIEVGATRVVRRVGRLVNRPTRIVDRVRRVKARPHRLNDPRAAPGGNHNGRMPIPMPPLLRISLSHSRQRQRK